MTFAIIISALIFIAYIAWRLYKVSILRFISKWDWGYRLTEAEYFRTKIGRERRKATRLKRVVKLADARSITENRTIYIMKLPTGGYWYGTSKEWLTDKKRFPKCQNLWPVVDHVYKTR